MKRRILSDRNGAAMIYDPHPSEVCRWINRRLRKHNMYWAQPGFGPWAAIVQLDLTKPLPENFFKLGETIWSEAFVYLDHLIEKGRVSKKWKRGWWWEIDHTTSNTRALL